MTSRCGLSWRRCAAAILGVVAVVTTSCTGLWTTSQTTPAYVRTITVSPDTGPPPPSPPGVLPYVTCTRDLGSGVTEAVFGYRSKLDLSFQTYTGARFGALRNYLRNEVWRSTPGGTAPEATGPQVLQFLPGDHPTEFAVRWSEGERVTWTIDVPDTSGEVAAPFRGLWRVSVTPRTGVPCDGSVPEHFAVVHQAALVFPGAASSVATDVRGALTGWALDIDITVDTRCSAGGVALDPDLDVVIGADNLTVEPVLGTREVQTFTGPVSLPITSARHFPAIDPQASAQLTVPATDVVGRCAFPDAPVPVPEVRSTTYWLDYPGTAVSAIPVDGIRDVGDGTVEPCFPVGGDCAATRVDVTAVAPGGVRYR